MKLLWLLLPITSLWAGWYGVYHIVRMETGGQWYEIPTWLTFLLITATSLIVSLSKMDD